MVSSGIHGGILKGVSTELTDNFTHDFPVSLIHKRVNAIRVRGFVGFKVEEGGLYLLLGRNAVQVVIVLLSRRAPRRRAGLILIRGEDVQC